MTDEDLADELIGRLNKLIEDEAVRRNMTALLEDRITCSGMLDEHPTVQVRNVDGACTVGFLGMLNGAVGVRPGTKIGYIRAVFDAKGWLIRFDRAK